jgi:hypothetical protein
MSTKKSFLLALALLICITAVSQLLLQGADVSSAANAWAPSAQGVPHVYLPLIFNQFGFTPAPTITPSPAVNLRRVNVPYFAGAIAYPETALFWFGQVTPSDNYADVRVGYNSSELFVSVNIFDRRLWYNPTPSTGPLTGWDATSLYLDLDGNAGSAPGLRAYRFDAQLNWWEPRTSFQAVYRGNGSNWITATTQFTSVSGWRGDAPNDNTDDRGWVISYHIPFASLGLSNPPPPQTRWGLALVVHDRDDAAGTLNPDQTWPEKLSPDIPSTWGQLSSGLPTYAPPTATPRGTVTLRQGLNGLSVPDAAVGGTIASDGSGSTLCPGDSNYIWNQWGNQNFGTAPRVNIQNQSDVADWPCFAKYYVTFPLSSLPSGKAIISATLTLHEFGNAGGPGQAQPSLIQISTVEDAWNGATLTWNNAPLASENVSRIWVNPVANWPGWPGVPWSWDVSGATARAYMAGKPLRLVLYEADSAYNSGKYFLASDEPDWDSAGRPRLDVLWGDP